MNDVARQLRSSRRAPPRARATVLHVLATILPTDAPQIAIGGEPITTSSPLQIKESVPRYGEPLAVEPVFATALETTSPYRPRLRRYT